MPICGCLAAGLWHIFRPHLSTKSKLHTKPIDQSRQILKSSSSSPAHLSILHIAPGPPCASSSPGIAVPTAPLVHVGGAAAVGGGAGGGLIVGGLVVGGPIVGWLIVGGLIVGGLVVGGAPVVAVCEGQECE